MIVLGATAGGIVLISIGRSVLFFRRAISGASKLHTHALAGVLGSPLAFFHTNPAGRVINRFSKDLGTIDETLPSVLFDCTQCVFQVIAVITVIGIGMPWALLAFLPLGALFAHFQQTYLYASRELKRLESTSRSPIFSSFQASLKGLPVIRSFARQTDFQDRFSALLDENGAWWFCFLGVNRWLGFRLDFLAGCVVLTLVVLAILLRDTLDQSLIALALSYVMQLSGLLQWTTRQTAELENLMTSTERLIEFANLEREGEIQRRRR